MKNMRARHQKLVYQHKLYIFNYYFVEIIFERKKHKEINSEETTISTNIPQYLTFHLLTISNNFPTMYINS